MLKREGDRERQRSRRAKERRKERRRESVTGAADTIACHDCGKPVVIHRERAGAIRCPRCRDKRRPADVELTHARLGPRPSSEEYQQQRAEAQATQTSALAHDPATKKPSAEHRAWVESLIPMIQATISPYYQGTVAAKLLSTAERPLVVTPAFLRVTLKHAKIDEVRSLKARAQREGRYADVVGFEIAEQNLALEGQPSDDDGGKGAVPVRGQRRRGPGYPPALARAERTDLMGRLSPAYAALLEAADAGAGVRGAADAAGLSRTTAHRQLSKAVEEAAQIADSSKAELLQMFRVAKHAVIKTYRKGGLSDRPIILDPWDKTGGRLRSISTEGRRAAMAKRTKAPRGLTEQAAARALGTTVEHLRNWNRYDMLVTPFRLPSRAPGGRFHPAMVPFGRFMVELRSMDRPELTPMIRGQLAQLVAERLVASWQEVAAGQPYALDVDLVYPDQPTVTIRFGFLASVPA